MHGLPNMDWDINDDTSNDINPIYAQKIKPNLLFGRGGFGGIDAADQLDIDPANTTHWSLKPKE